MKYVKRMIEWAVFAVVLCLLLKLVSGIVAPKNNLSGFGMEEVTANGILGEKENTIDAVIIGDSESYSAVTPMQMWKEAGIAAYVCGSSAQTLDYSTELLRRTMQKQNPSVVILETNAIYRKVSAGQAFITRLAGFFPVFQYHDRWKSLGWNDLTGKTEFTWTDDCKGYRFAATVNGTSAGNYMAETDREAEIPDENMSFLYEIRALCEEGGARLVLLSTPSTVNWNRERHNGIAALAEELSADYIDLNLRNEEVGIDWSRDTRDRGDHLNYSGAVKVTRWLTKYLTELGILHDHRNDENYSRWNEALTRYEAVVSQK